MVRGVVLVRLVLPAMLSLALTAVLAVDVDIATARAHGQKQQFEWSKWSDETFARAKREKKFILLDCAAEWCHWCHVMDETTYADPDIGKILNDRFIAIKVDIDERPDLAERYGTWGWPATVIFSPDAEELGKFRGYLSPEELKSALRVEQVAGTFATKAPVLPVDALRWLGVRVTMDMDEWYDPVEGSWGRRQKAPIGANIEFELRRADRKSVV